MSSATGFSAACAEATGVPLGAAEGLEPTGEDDAVFDEISLAR